jgi:hypothetical protein
MCLLFHTIIHDMIYIKIGIRRIFFLSVKEYTFIDVTVNKKLTWIEMFFSVLTILFLSIEIEQIKGTRNENTSINNIVSCSIIQNLNVISHIEL